MDVLELNGNKYVKASSIARELGYTADYVGQLCRGGKVEAKLVGRSWYVDDTSIRSHKNSRYRSNKSKTADGLKHTISLSQNPANKAIVKTVPVFTKNFYKKIKPNEAKYTEDATELVPVLTEKNTDGEYSELKVEQADSKHISIKKTKNSYTLKATKLPHIQFTGDLSVIEPIDKIEEGKQEISVDKQIDNEETKHILVKQKPFKKVTDGQERVRKERIQSKIHSVEDNKSKKIPLRRPGVISMARVSKTSVGVTELNVKMCAESPTYSGRASFLYVMLSLFVALIVSAGFVFVESLVVVTPGDFTRQTTYRVNVSTAFQAF